VSRKLNCWEFKNCGREKGGLMVNSIGECPVASAMQYDGMNSGVAAGRVCEFYRRVVHEEADNVQCAFQSVLV